MNNLQLAEDEKCITFSEIEGVTHIYLRENTPDSEQPSVSYELVEYICRLLDIPANDANIVRLLLDTPTETLPLIAEDNKIFISSEPPPEGSDPNSGMDADDDASSACRNCDDGDSANADESDEGEMLDTSKSAWKSAARPLETCHRRSSTPYLLQDLIPSHQAAATTIASKAEHFHISSATIIHQVSGEEGRQPWNRQSHEAIRVRQDDPSGDQSSIWPNMTLAGPAQIETSEPRETLSISTGHVPGGVSHRSAPADTRERQVGFLGELFVRHSSK